MSNCRSTFLSRVAKKTTALLLTLPGLAVVADESGPAASLAPENFTPEELAERVNGREANKGRVGVMHFSLENRRGHKRSRTAKIFHSDEAEATNVAIYFTAPGAIEDTAFLSLDRQTSDDENWLYLPATERVRRLPASERGDYFMGTDLTYGDIKDNFKFADEDWNFVNCSQSPWSAADLPCLAGEVANPSIAKELGYSRFIAAIDVNTWFPSRLRYFDTDGTALKDVVIERQQKIGGAWTAMEFTLSNLQSGHSTKVHFTDMQDWPALPNSVFDANSLEFGIPQITPANSHGE